MTNRVTTPKAARGELNAANQPGHTVLCCVRDGNSPRAEPRGFRSELLRALHTGLVPRRRRKVHASRFESHETEECPLRGLRSGHVQLLRCDGLLRPAATVVNSLRNSGAGPDVPIGGRLRKGRVRTPNTCSLSFRGLPRCARKPNCPSNGSISRCTVVPALGHTQPRSSRPPRRLRHTATNTRWWGKAHNVKFRLYDIDTRDNYGSLTISLRDATPADCSGTKYLAFGLSKESECLSWGCFRSRARADWRSFAECGEGLERPDGGRPSLRILTCAHARLCLDRTLPPWRLG